MSSFKKDHNEDMIKQHVTSIVFVGSGSKFKLLAFPLITHSK